MILDIAYWITQFFLAVGAVGAVYRVYRGPSVLDRVMSVDVILIIVASVMLIDMTYRDHQDYLLFVVVTAVIGFLGAVAIARYVVLRQPEGERSIAVSAQADTGDEADAEPASEEKVPDAWFEKLTRSGFDPGPDNQQPREGPS